MVSNMYSNNRNRTTEKKRKHIKKICSESKIGYNTSLTWFATFAIRFSSGFLLLSVPGAPIRAIPAPQLSQEALGCEVEVADAQGAIMAA